MTDYRTQPINQKNADFVEQVADRIEEMQLEGRSLWQDAKRRFFRNKAAVASLIYFGVYYYIYHRSALVPSHLPMKIPIGI